jgi:hypothetical protein
MQPLSTWGLIVYLWNHWNDIQDAWAGVLTAISSLLGAVVALATLITPFTKTPVDDRMVDKLKALMHQFSVTNPK